jgi:ubiquinone biosynthesis accessory factor UbiJ
MPIQSPIALLQAVFQPFSDTLPPPLWAQDEFQRRIVLLLNHILLQEKEALARLSRQKGRVVLFQWRQFSFKWIATPAGLLDLAKPDAPVDLTLVVSQDSPIELFQTVLMGDKPAVRIAGDVQLAAEVNWLVDHLRWDLEEDLARIVGDAPAHGLCLLLGHVKDALRQLTQRFSDQAPAGARP